MPSSIPYQIFLKSFQRTQVEARHNGGGELRPVAVLGFTGKGAEIPNSVVGDVGADDMYAAGSNASVGGRAMRNHAL
jgi:hypothetical protein